MKKLISLILALLCVLGTMTCAVSAADEKIESERIHIVNVKTGEYVNFDYGRLQNGTYVRVYPADGTVEQDWVLRYVGGVWYILTYKSKSYCLDLYRGNSKPAKNQKMDIWRTGDDPIAQEFIISKCDNGYFQILLAADTTLALSADQKGGRVKLDSAKESAKAQQWKFVSVQTGKTINPTSLIPSVKLPTSVYMKTGNVYTIDGAKYSEATTTRAYNDIPKGSLFFVDAKGYVVNNANTLDKLYHLSVFEGSRATRKAALDSLADAAKLYYEVYTSISKMENLGTLIGKSSGILLSIGAGNPFGIEEAMLELGEHYLSPEYIKGALLMSLVRAYANNAIAYGCEAYRLMDEPAKDYDTLKQVAELYAKALGSFEALEYLAGEEIREMAGSNTAKELRKYFENVILGLADTVIPDIPMVEITKYVTDGVIALADFDASSKTVYTEEYKKSIAFLSVTYEDARTVADALSKPEKSSFTDPLVSSYKTNIVTQKFGNRYNGSYHLGLDLGTSANKKTNVVSITGATVYKVVKNNSGWGNMVITKSILNGTTFYTGYAHLKSIEVREGDVLEAGALIGQMGNTGNSTGPHLHLLVFTGKFDKSMLPAGYSSKKFTGNSIKVGSLTYWDPAQVIATNGEILK